MPYVQAAYDMTPDWEKASSRPTGVILRFINNSDAPELHRFIDIFDQFREMNRGTYTFDPEPLVLNDKGKIIPIELLRLIRKYQIPARISFVLFGDYFREILREYCVRSLDFHDDEDVRMGFVLVLHNYELENIDQYIH